MRLTATQQELIDQARKNGGRGIVTRSQGRGPHGGRINHGSRQRDALLALESGGIVCITDRQTETEYNRGHSVTYTIWSFHLAPHSGETMKIKYIQDPGHGWIAVPLDLIAEWGIAPSPYSYRDESTGYLEEDCDAGLFVRAAADRGVSVEFVESHSNHDSFVRNLPRFKGAA